MGVPGHEEVEIGLVKLFRATGNEEYLKLARFYLDQRGNAQGHELYGVYNQDHEPVIQQSTAVGHAVRAAYLYTGMADVAALTGAEGYVAALDRIWTDVLTSKLYLTGGIGAEHEGEAMGDQFHLPNRTACTPTRAAIANAMWNYRMFACTATKVHRRHRADRLQHVPLQRRAPRRPVFDVDPLVWTGSSRSSDKSNGRRPWFRCSGCPPNAARFLASFGSYVTPRATTGSTSTCSSAADARRSGRSPRGLRQATEYPWKGDVAISVKPDAEVEIALHVRVPGRRGSSRRRATWTLQGRRRASVHALGQRTVGEGRAGPRLRRPETALEVGVTVQLLLPMPVRRVARRAGGGEQGPGRPRARAHRCRQSSRSTMEATSSIAVPARRRGPVGGATPRPARGRHRDHGRALARPRGGRGHAVTRKQDFLASVQRLSDRGQDWMAA